MHLGEVIFKNNRYILCLSTCDVCVLEIASSHMWYMYIFAGIMSAEGILDDPAIFSSAGNGSGRSLHPHPEEHPIEVLSIPLVTTDSNATADLSHGKAKRKIVKKIREIERLQAKLETPDEAGTLTADERKCIRTSGWSFQKQILLISAMLYFGERLSVRYTFFSLCSVNFHQRMLPICF